MRYVIHIFCVLYGFVCTYVIHLFHVLHVYSTEHEIRTEKCLDTCQHKIKFVLTFAKNDLTLVEISTVALYYGSDICQTKLGFVQVNPKSAQKMSMTSDCYFML